MILLLVAASVVWYKIEDADIWWHLASGRHVWSERSVPLTEPFSYLSEGKPWLDEYWLYQLILLAIWTLGGPFGLVAAKMVFAVCLIGTFFVSASKRGVQAELSVIAALLALFVLAIRLTGRPELVGWAGLLTYTLWLPRGTALPDKKTLVILPLVQAVWTNCHPSFVIGPLTCGLAMIGQLLNQRFDSSISNRAVSRRLLARRYTLFLVLIVGATFLNPYGWRIYTPLFKQFGSPLLMNITEYQPVWEFDIWYIKLAPAILSIAVFGSLWISRAKVDFIHLLWVGAYFALGLTAIRHVPLFAIVSMPVIAESLESGLNDGQKRTIRSAPVRVGTAVILLTLAMLFGTGWIWYWNGRAREPGYKIEEWRFPLREAAFVKKVAPSGNGFHGYQEGDYLLWGLYPAKQTTVDTRNYVHGDSLIQEVRSIGTTASAWRKFFADHDIHWALLSGEQEKLIQALAAEPNWFLVYFGPNSVVFADNSTSNNQQIILENEVKPKDLELLVESQKPHRQRLLFAPSVGGDLQYRARLLLGLNASLLAAMTIDSQKSGLDNKNLRALRYVAWFRVGVTAMERKNLKQAESAFKSAIAADSKKADAWNNLGFVYVYTGNKDAARECWNRVLSMDPSNVTAQANLQRLGH
ncbi:MAG: tetratricopeptide repeat protein [Candidatus Sumerlaeaceae bacterium]